MIARKVYVRLKPNTLGAFVDLMEREISPWLRTQDGFLDSITLAEPDGSEVQVLSFWKRDRSGGSQRPYPADMVRRLEKLLDGITYGRTFDVVNSTLERFSPSALGTDQDCPEAMHTSVLASVPTDTDPDWRDPFLSRS